MPRNPSSDLLQCRNALPVAAVLALVAAGCAERTSAPQPLPPVLPIESPAAAGSGEPNLSAAPDGRVLLSWIEPADSGHSLRFAVLGDAGWGEARTIAQGTDWFVNWADFPALLELSDGSLAAHFLQRSGSGAYAYDIRIVRSMDGGVTWSEPITPHRDSTAAEHGFVTLYDAGVGALGAIWLDGRRYAAGDEQMTLRHAVMDADGALVEESEIDARVCDCCQTTVAQTADGIVVFYRDRSGDEIRDIAASSFTGGEWSTPRRVHADDWRLEACPVNGPKADARGDDVALAWFTAPDDDARVHVAFSRDGGETFAEPIQIDDGSPSGRVDLVLMEDGTAVVSWLERVEGAAEIRLRRVAADGAMSESSTLTRTGAERASGFPRMALTGSRLVLAWTEPGAQQGATRSTGADGAPAHVRTAYIDLPR